MNYCPSESIPRGVEAKCSPAVAGDPDNLPAPCEQRAGRTRTALVPSPRAGIQSARASGVDRAVRFIVAASGVGAQWPAGARELQDWAVQQGPTQVVPAGRLPWSEPLTRDAVTGAMKHLSEVESCGPGDGTSRPARAESMVTGSLVSGTSTFRRRCQPLMPGNSPATKQGQPHSEFLAGAVDSSRRGVSCRLPLQRLSAGTARCLR